MKDIHRLFWLVACIVAVLAAVWLGWFAGAEGFQNQAFQYAVTNFSKECEGLASCGDCLKRPYCGWCSGAQKCVARLNMLPIIPMSEAKATEGVTAIGGGMSHWLDAGDETQRNTAVTPLFQCPKDTFWTKPEQCPDFKCSDYTNCGDCALNSLCGWCRAGKKCMSLEDVSTRKETCLGPLTRNPGECPVVPCADLSGCKACTATRGCGYCRSEKKCIAMRDLGLGDAKSCSAANTVQYGMNCDASGVLPTTGLSFLSESDGVKATAGGPGPGSWNDTGRFKPAGPIVPGSSLVTSPGRAVPMSQPMELPKVGADLSLPFEYYVRGMVRQELMQNGVPITESFQDGTGAPASAAAPAPAAATGRGIEPADKVLGQIQHDYAKLQAKLYGGGA